ncbi:MAG: hypothetical protein Q4A60_05190 [Pasteurellaceae bacterium]|nr:hypothetical protein [Pasteurellaceae bacterium]
MWISGRGSVIGVFQSNKIGGILAQTIRLQGGTFAQKSAKLPIASSLCAFYVKIRQNY